MGVKRVLRYIEGTLAYGLKFSANGHEVDLYGFSDANWAGDVDNQHSTSENIFRQAYSTNSWCSKKHGAVRKSTTEVEYVTTIIQATQEVICLQKLLADLGYKADLQGFC